MTLDIQSQLSTLCDIEPIHLLSQIQPSGVLFVVSYDDLKILQVSENVEGYFGITKDSVLTQSLFECFEHSFGEKIVSHLQYLQEMDKNFHTFKYLLNNEIVFCVLHRQLHYVILEIARLDLGENFSPETVISTILESQKSDTFEELSDFIVKSVQKISGFDRVLLYKFDDEKNGTVLTQSSDVLDENFVGHRFPASDIPAQARELYIKNKFRIIEDVFAKNVNISPVSNPLTLKPIDMSFCYFRSVSSMHIEYLKNMGVASSMSISIVIEGKLWGLIACHHYEAKKLPLTSYQTYPILSAIFSSMIEQKEKLTSYEISFELRLKRELFFNSLNSRRTLPFPKAIDKNLFQLKELIRCEYCILLYDDVFYCERGEILSKDLSLLEKLVCNNIQNGIFYTHKMGIDYPEIRLEDMSLGGLLAVRVEGLQNAYIFFLREEQIYTIQWAGEPNKQVEFKNNTIVLNPRASFESWKETVVGTSAIFSTEEIECAKLLSVELKLSYEHFLNYEESRILKQQHKIQEQFLLQNALEKRVFLERERLLNSIGEGVYGVDLDMNCFFINPTALEMLLLQEEDILGKNPHTMIHHNTVDGDLYGKDDCIVYNTILHEKKNERYDWLFKSNGEKFPVKIIATPIYNETLLVGVVVAFTDISRQYYAEQDLQKLNEKLQIQAITDPLTQLYNQRYFKEYGLKQFELAKKENSELCMIVVGINYFAKIKSMYGNDICDAILVMIGNILKSKLRNRTDIVARIGWEEFSILLPHISSLEASKMMEVIDLEIQNESIFLNGIRISCTASVGVICYKSELFSNLSDFIRAGELKLILAQKKLHNKNTPNRDR